MMNARREEIGRHGWAVHVIVNELLLNDEMNKAIGEELRLVFNL